MPFKKLMEGEIAKFPEIQDELLVDPINKQNIHALIQSILIGENPYEEETTEQWCQRIESYAAELERELYR